MAIRWDKLTLKSQEAMEKASTLAAENGNPELLPLHLLTSLLGDSEGVIVPVLEKIGVSTPQLLTKASSVEHADRTAFRGFSRRQSSRNFGIGPALKSNASNSANSSTRSGREAAATHRNNR